MSTTLLAILPWDSTYQVDLLMVDDENVVKNRGLVNKIGRHTLLTEKRIVASSDSSSSTYNYGNESI